MGHDHHDHHEHLANVDEGKSLLPQIVHKELELQRELERAKAEAEALVRQAEKRRDEAVEKARQAIPQDEEAFLKSELAAYEKELQDLERSEKQRLAALRTGAEKKIDEAAKAVAALALKFGT